MTTELRKAIDRLLAADSAGGVASAQEGMDDALRQFGEWCRREAIQSCAGIARSHGAGGAADDMLALMDV